MSIMELVGSVFSISYGVSILFVLVFLSSYVKRLAPCSCPSYVFSSNCVFTLVFYFCILKFEFLKFGFWLLLVLWDSSFCLLHWVLGFYQGHMVSHFLVSICYNGLVCLSFVSNHF
jgi:hypothetical protein